jgi:hypothetical protein
METSDKEQKGGRIKVHLLQQDSIHKLHKLRSQIYLDK